MNKSIRVIALSLLLVLLQGCASKPLAFIDPQLGEHNEVTWVDGRKLVSSTASKTIVRLSKGDKRQYLGERISLFVQVENQSTDAIHLMIGSITSSSDGRTLKVYPPEELIAEIEASAKWQRMGLALQGFGAGVSGDEEKNRNFESQKRKVESDHRSSLEAIERDALESTTLTPGSVIAGEIWVEPPGAESFPAMIKVSIDLGGETHFFSVLYGQQEAE
jgi:hypothetical protein